MAAGQRMAAPPWRPASRPPLPLWFAGIDGAQAGPFDLGTLGAQIRSGAIGRSTLVWKNGMAQWTPAEQVPELASLFAAVPPPQA